MHDNPYRAQEGEARTPKPMHLARRLFSTALLTAGVLLALPSFLVAMMGFDWFVYRRYPLSSGGLWYFVFSFLLFVAAPPLLIGAGVFVRRRRR